MDLFVIVICLNIPAVLPAPLLQLLQLYPRISMQPQQNLQQQLLELQTMEHLQQMSPFQINAPRPLLILLPDQTINAKGNTNQRNKERYDTKLKHDDQINSKHEEDLNSVVIDAEPMPILEEQKAILLLPTGRFSIGDFISGIPFLPIEINVPDTISWAYNGIAEGISGIISIIGSRLPFQKPSQDMPSNDASLKSMINRLQLRNGNNQRPFLLLPLNELGIPNLPLQL